MKQQLLIQKLFRKIFISYTLFFLFIIASGVMVELAIKSGVWSFAGGYLGSILISTISCLILFLATLPGLRQSQKELQQQLLDETQDEKSKVQMLVARQVSHDIRSPLSALNMIISTLGSVPEEKRTILRNSVQRINDIANNLLAEAQKSHPETSSSSSEQMSVSTELLSPIIDALISEKRMQYRDQLHVDIDANTHHGYGLFANINSSEFKRVLSNLINNSVEAFEKGKGRLVVHLRGDEKNIQVVVSDNGRGIPQQILSQLGSMGFSHGKENQKGSGNGLGLYHAKNTIEKFGGQLMIQSNPGLGTIITIELPRQKAPAWFVEKLVLPPKSEVIVLDDDNSVHQIWRGRYQSLRLEEQGIQFVHFSSGTEFETYVNQLGDRKNKVTYLVDYELLGQSMTGLDLIEKLGIGPHSIMVTSRFEEPKIRQRCAKLKTPLIPKGLAGFVPIQVDLPLQNIDYILLDDDELVHMTWSMTAQQKGFKLLSFRTPQDLMAQVGQIDKKTPVYIDSNLGNKVRGENVAKELADLGFQELYIATGYSPENFSHVTWVKGIVGKDPAF